MKAYSRKRLFSKIFVYLTTFLAGLVFFLIFSIKEYDTEPVFSNINKPKIVNTGEINSIGKSYNIRDTAIFKHESAPKLITIFSPLVKKQLSKCTRLIKEKPGNPDNYIDRGDVYKEAGQFKNALKNYSQAITVNNSSNIYPQNYLFEWRAELYEYMFECKKDTQYCYPAIDDYTTAIKLDPQDTNVYTSRANLYLTVNNFRNAVTDYEKALQLNPYDLESMAHISEAYRKLNDFEKHNEYNTKLNDICKSAYSVSTVDEAVDFLMNILNSADLNEIKNTPPAEVIKYHFSLGMSIRNSFGLWGGNYALLASCGGIDMHPDDALMIIIEALWLKLNGKYIREEDRINQYVNQK